MNLNYPKKFKSSPGLIGRVLLVIAALLALYLASISLTQTYLPGCENATGCHELMSSQWAHIFGIPASFPAVALYLIEHAVPNNAIATEEGNSPASSILRLKEPRGFIAVAPVKGMEDVKTRSCSDGGRKR